MLKQLSSVFILALLWATPAFAGTAVGTPAAGSYKDNVIIIQTAIPFLKASTGSMGNNGAITAMTASVRTLSNGAYIYLVSGAICTTCNFNGGVASAAGWYWFVGSSTTAGTVYNSTYTSGVPIRGTTTAFAETGPGAFLGSTGTITAIQVTIPANSMGASGRIAVNAVLSNNTAAGNKVPSINYGGTSCFSATFTTQASIEATCALTNRGVTNVQAMSYTQVTSAAAASEAIFGTNGAIDSTADQTLAITLNTAADTNLSMLESYKVVVTHGD